MSKIEGKLKLKLSSTFWDGFMFISGMVATLVIVRCFPLITPPSIIPSSVSTKSNIENATTFYDEPELGYLMDDPIKNWDEKRHKWLASHPSFSGSEERVLMVTGSQPKPCKTPGGDHMMLRLFKNKVDYCRIHGHELFYNNVLLHPGMFSFWAKYPVIKAAMLAHPEAEWIWWVDSDAVFTDMDFNLPLEKYKDYNLIVYGWPGTLYKDMSSMGLNAGVFLIRNCQWSMNFLERWASFGPQTPDYAKWGQVQQSIFSDKTDLKSDDQAALCYMVLIEKEQWADKFFLETEYFFQAYFIDVIDNFEDAASHYADIERRNATLRRKHAEKDGEEYRAVWKQYLDDAGTPVNLRRPFVTHFTGCSPCPGDNNPMYSEKQCKGGMIRALNLGDSQVLRSFGYTRRDLTNSSSVEPL